MAPERLLRFALSPEGRVVADFAGKLPGRGAWVTARRGAVEAAAAKGAFARAFKAPASLEPAQTPAEFADAVEAGLSARALAALGLARRAGAVVAGFEKTRIALEEGRVMLLLIARDAAGDGAAKLQRAAQGVDIVRAFDSAGQSQAIGLDGVMHVALLKSPHAPRAARAIERLLEFRGVAQGAAPA